MRPELRSVLAGASTGARSFTALALLVARAPDGARRGPDQYVRRPWVKVVTALGAVQELVMDKLPQAPSRLEALGLASRGVCAAGSGEIIAYRTFDDRAAEDGPTPAQHAFCVGAALAGAAGGAWLGARWRSWSASRWDDTLLPALAEDAVAGLLAVAAAFGR